MVTLGDSPSGITGRHHRQASPAGITGRHHRLGLETGRSTFLAVAGPCGMVPNLQTEPFAVAGFPTEPFAVAGPCGMVPNLQTEPPGKPFAVAGPCGMVPNLQTEPFAVAGPCGMVPNLQTEPPGKPLMFFKLSYLLQHYRFWGISLQRWLMIGLALLAVLMALRILPGGTAATLLCLLLIPVSIIANAAARRSQYVQFRSDSAAPPRPAKLNPTQRLTIHATGLFEVQDKQRRYSEVSAHYQTFATREHALTVAAVEETHWHGLLRGSDDARGLWYLFFKPGELHSVEAGILRNGFKQRPALRLEIGQVLHRQSPSDAWGIPPSRDAKAERRQLVYLSFATPEDRDKVWGDLLADRIQA